MRKNARVTMMKKVGTAVNRRVRKKRSMGSPSIVSFEPARPAISHGNMMLLILASESSERHFRNVRRNHKFGLGRRSHFGGGYSRARLEQGCTAIAECDHGELGHDQVHGAHRRDRQGAAL